MMTDILCAIFYISCYLSHLFEMILLPIEKETHLYTRHLLNKIDVNNGHVTMVQISEKHQLPNDEKR